MDKPIYVFVKWQIKSDSRQTVLNLLPELIEKSSNEKGNLTYKIFQDKSNTNTLLLLEAYSNEESIEEHRQSKHFQDIVIKQIVPLLENREMTLTSEFH